MSARSVTLWSDMKALEGQRVQVILAREPEVIHEGILRSLDEYGEVLIENKDGTVGSSWPALEMRVDEKREEKEGI